MSHSTLLRPLVALVAMLALALPGHGDEPAERVLKTRAEWARVLTPLQYQVTRRKQTEPAFTGEYWNCHKDGAYHCVCCEAALFDSQHKFDSGTGWPSFFQPVADNLLRTKIDTSNGERRLEVICKRCNAHLGHVFSDGPRPTGLRFCINSAALKLEERPEK